MFSVVKYLPIVTVATDWVWKALDP